MTKKKAAVPKRAKARRDDVDWVRIEEQIKAGASSRTVGREHKISHSAILARSRKEGWILGRKDWKAEARNTKTAQTLANPVTVSDRRIVAFGKRTPETMAKILHDIEAHGASYRLAAQAVGIGADTLAIWRKEDPDFARLIQSARARHLVMQNSHMVKAAKRGQWQAAARILEAAPETREDWGQKPGQGGANITINFRFTRDPEQPPMVDVTPGE